MSPQITLFLMTEKGFNFLNATFDCYGHMFGLVVVGSDTSLQNDFEDEIINFCKLNNIQFIKKTDFVSVNSEYAIAVSWRWMIPHNPKKLIVFHDSLLPRYRGFAPLVTALIKGEREVGVTAILGDVDFDSGAIIAQSKSKLTYPIKISDAIDLVGKNYTDTAKIVFDSILREDLTSIPQNESLATYSLWLNGDDYIIDWSKSADDIARFIDALGYPYLGACTFIDGEAIRIISAEVVSDVKIEIRQPGKILFTDKGRPIVVCGFGLLKIMDAYYDGDSQKNLIPIKKFRCKFTS